MAALVAGAACTAAAPPPGFLKGAWGRSEAACKAGFVMTFESDAVRLFDGEAETTLLAAPRFRVRRDEGVRIVEIRYRLPSRPGGVSAAAGRGVVVLAEQEDGALVHRGERFEDARTGAVWAPLNAEEAALAAAFPIIPCAGPAFDTGLRGAGGR